MEAVLDDAGVVILDAIAVFKVERARVEPKIVQRALVFNLRRRESELALDPRIG